MKDFSEIRNLLLEEGKSSPNLLSDLAGLENYIGESYNNRSFIELLQNADDANSSRFKIIKKDKYLFVANDGREFDNHDLESLCRSASSNKVRGESIGYRGIGFKSVVGFAKEIHLISGDLEITFSKIKTILEIPLATRVPLIRVPHKLSIEDKAGFESIINDLKINGFTTIFVFSGVTAHEIELEFASFDTSSLLFLRNISETELDIGFTNKTSIEKKVESRNIARINILGDKSTSSWLIVKNEEVSIGFNIEDQKIKKLDYANSIVYSFLPTEDTTGLGVIINGDFSTDPSRKRVIYDEKTLLTIKSCAKHIINILELNVQDKTESNFEMINALIPFIDPRMLQFKRPSFEKYILNELRNNESHLFANLNLCPNWFNYKDYSLLTKQNGTSHINPQCYHLEGFLTFAKYLGAKEDSLSNFKSNINSVQVSILGCVQITSQLFKGIILKTINYDNSIYQLKIIMSNNERISLDELRSNNAIIDQSFLSLLIENGLTEFDIKQVLSEFLSPSYCESLFDNLSNKVEYSLKIGDHEKKSSWFTNTPSRNYPATKLSVHRWRSAEENALEVLNSNGFNLSDVSKQNIGYDYEGFDPDGNEIQIEVKSITLVGQAFKLTNNEIAVAQDKKDSYYLAVVRQLENFIEIALIPDPIKNLIFNRQCVQWIWECSNYDYNPIKFEI